MKMIELAYGNTKIPFEYDGARFDVLGESAEDKPLSDLELGRLFDAPLDSERIEDLVKPSQTVLIVVPDGTRRAGAGQIINLLVRRLIAAGTMPFEISTIFATGLHRKVTTAEKAEILTPFIAQRVTAFDHEPAELLGMLRVGETTGGVPVELNRKLVEADHVILIGSIGFHYFAGFTGGRKLICPGLASKRTIKATHSLAFDTVLKGRADGVMPGKLVGNRVHKAFVEAADFIKPSFLFNTFVDETGNVTDLVCGDWQSSHRAACQKYSDAHVIEISEKRKLVIVSAGGAPFDLNLVQAHKALEMASYACTDGGTIVLLAECSDGLGGTDFEKAFELSNSAGIGEKLAQKYTVGGQTAWSLRKKSENFDVRIITGLPDEFIKRTGMRKYDSLAAALESSAKDSSGYVMQKGAQFLPHIEK